MRERRADKWATIDVAAGAANLYLNLALTAAQCRQVDFARTRARLALDGLEWALRASFVPPQKAA